MRDFIDRAPGISAGSMVRPGLSSGCGLAGFLALLFCHIVSASTYYVSPLGNDSDLGLTLDQPLKSLSKAGRLLVPGDTCVIRGGIYRETVSLALSGTAAAPIRLVGYDGEVATISACDVVTGWTASSNDTFQASVSWDLGLGKNQTFLDGTMIHEARYPDHGTGDLLHPATSSVQVTSAGNIITSSAWSGKPDNYWVGSWFRGGINETWAWQTARVTKSTGDKITVDGTSETTSWWFTGPGVGWLWGTRSLLDSDHEWVREGANLFLRVGAGESPENHIVEAKKRTWCLDLNGRSYVTIENLNFFAGALRLGGDGNVLSNCCATHLNHFTRILTGSIDDGGFPEGGGLLLGGRSNLVTGCTISNCAGSGIRVTGSKNVISRNSISGTDYSGTYGVAVSLLGSGNVLIFNTVRGSGRDLIHPDGPASVIQFNDFSESGLLCRDEGLLYVWGKNGQSGSVATRIAFNWLHDNNHFTNAAAPLVYLDNYCRNFIVDHNVCWNSVSGDAGIRVNRPATGHAIYNNTLFFCSDVGAWSYDAWPANNPDSSSWTKDVFQYSSTNNLYLAGAPEDQLVAWDEQDFTLKANAIGVDTGTIVAGFTDNFRGQSPDLGAYEQGALPWRAGRNARPILSIENSAAQLQLRASAEATQCFLETAPSLSDQAQWTRLTNTFTATGGDCQLRLSLPESKVQFFRLVSR